jgi:hypothetical protein
MLQCDVHDTGSVPIDEIINLLVRMGLVDASDEGSLMELFAAADSDRDGAISFEDFRQSFSSMMTSAATSPAHTPPCDNDALDAQPPTSEFATPYRTPLPAPSTARPTERYFTQPPARPESPVYEATDNSARSSMPGSPAPEIRLSYMSHSQQTEEVGETHSDSITIL